MTTNRVNLAFIGAGTVAGPFGRAVAANPSASFAGVFDPATERSEQVVARLGGRVYHSLDEVNADAAVDAVIVMNPPDVHVDSARACLAAGKHVLVEKPVARTVDEIDELIALSAKMKRVCMPAHNYIYVPSLQRAKRFVEEGRFGRIASLWILYNLYHPDALAKTYGGVLREVCVHHAYSLLYLLGRPKRLTAVTSCLRDDTVAREDQVMVTCQMRGGAIANLWASFAVNDTTSDPWTVIYKILGTRGGISYTWNDAQFDDRGGPAWGMPDYVEGFANELDFFLKRAIPRGETPLSSLHDARDAIRIIEVAEETISLKNGSAEIRYG